MDAFERIYKQHAAGVYRAVLRNVQRPEIAEEITSEVFMELHKHWNTEARERLPEWLYTVARNRTADYWRSRFRELAWAQTTAPVEAQAPVTETPLTELLSKCADLKPAHRSCVLLRFAYGMSRQEIAAELGIPEMQVKHNLQYALRLLRQMMTETRSRSVTERSKLRV